MKEIVYNAEPTLSAFHRDRSFVRGIRGPIGSGKSVACCWEIYLKSVAQKADPHGVRRSRWAAIRNTYPELKTTTVKTWLEWFQDFGVMHWSGPPSFILKQPLEDGTMLELELLFLAIDTESHVKKLLSLELTGCWLNEARELPRAVIVNAMQRVGRFPRKDGLSWSGVIMDTNSPSDRSWWYQAAEIDRPDGWKFFDQPPAVFETSDGKYELNPAAENLRNIPKGPRYYLDLLSGMDKDTIDVMLKCEYKSLFTGKPVYQGAFRTDFHVSKTPLAVLPDRDLVLAFDFGLTPACVAAQEDAGGQLRILAEFVSEDMGLVQFLENLIMPELRGRFRNLAVRCVGDPAGVQRAQADSTVSCAGVFADYGLSFTPAPTNDFEPRRRAVLNRLSRFALNGPALLLDSRCTFLAEGFRGGYQFQMRQVRTSGGETKYSETPEKNLYSHIHDAVQYLCLEFDPVKSESEGARAELLRSAMRESARLNAEYRRLGR